MHANVQKAIILTFSVTNRLFSKTRTVSRRKRLIAPFDIPHLVSGINCLVLSVNLILVLCLRSACSCSCQIFSPCQLTTLTIHISLCLSLPPQDLNLPLSLSHHRLPSSLRTDSTDFMIGPFLLSILVFVVSFFIILFCSFRAALSWLLVSFWAHFNIVHRIVSYRIISSCVQYV